MNDRQPYMRQGRCVHCNKLTSIPGEPCRYSTSGHGTMDLPPGKTCADCLHLPRCQAIFGRIPTDERCDWYPVRWIFRQVAQS